MVKQIKFDSEIRDNIKIWNKTCKKRKQRLHSRSKGHSKDELNLNKLYLCYSVISGKLRFLYDYAENYSVSEMALNIGHHYGFFINLSLLGQYHNGRLKAFVHVMHLDWLSRAA